MKFYNRDGAEVTDMGVIKTGAIDDWNPCTIHGIDGVIDVVLISHDGSVMSVKPTAFQPYAQRIGTHQSASWVEGNVWCTENIKVPIDTFKFGLTADNLADSKGTEYLPGYFGVLNPAIKICRGAWGETDSKRKNISDTSGIWKTLMKNHPKNNNYFWPSDNKFGGCTEFSILFGDVDVFSWLIREGYHFFNSEFINRSNWIRFESRNNDHDSFLMVMYISIPLLMLERNVLSDDAEGSITNSLRDKSKADIATKPLIHAVCETGPVGEPEMFLWSTGDYFMGSSLYSVNGRFKFVVQGDGNLVLYEMNTYRWSPKWATNTSNAVYARPKLTIENNGKMTISGTVIPQKDGPKSMVVVDPNTSNGAYLIISPNGELIYKEKNTGNVLWTMNSEPVIDNTTVFSNYFENGFRFESDHDYPLGSCIYSPNLVYSLCLQEDGNFVLMHIMKSQVIWDTKSYGKEVTKLAVQKDGNVVLYTKDNNVVWNTWTFWTNDVHLVVDNTGVALLLAKVNDSSWALAWASEPTSWKRLHAGKGIAYSQRSPYATVAATLVNAKTLPDVVTDSKFCQSDAYKPSIDTGARLSARVDYCMKDYNILLDQQACKPFFDKDIVGDNSGAQKTKMDNYVTDLCNPATFETRFKFQPAIQTLLNQFCSCVSPLGISQEIMKKATNQSFSPLCFDKDCINSGYKTKGVYSAGCPSCMCMNLVNANNSTLTGVSQTCAMGCTNLIPEVSGNIDQDVDLSVNVTKNENEGGNGGGETTNKEANYSLIYGIIALVVVIFAILVAMFMFSRDNNAGIRKRLFGRLGRTGSKKTAKLHRI
jgi:hypothetical protein